jgi:leukotriene-A4 hydrolase
MARLMRTLLLASVALAACQLAPDEPESPLAGPPPIAPDVHSFAEPARVRVTRVELDLELDFEAREARGEVGLLLARSDPDAPLILDTHDLVIESVVGDDATPRRWSLGAEGGRLGRPLVIELDDEDQGVLVRYRTTSASEALQWLAPEQTAGGAQPFLYSQGQAILTRSWIPLQDSPGVRVTYAARVRAPAGLTVVMSAQQLGADRDGAFQFRMDYPVPPYLIAIAAGELEFRQLSSRAGVWAEPSVVERAQAELSDTEAMIAAAEALFGPYRWGRYDVLVLPPSFPYGGMENPTLTFATPTILAGDKSLVALVAHELAHSWSGNLVTNATWSDFWLNEGFTTYCENRIMEALYGPERAATERVLETAELEEELEELDAWQEVLRLDLASHHPDDGFSGVPYTKGALFLARLEELFGRPRWDRFLRDYFDRHAFQSITSADFVAYLERDLLAGDPERAAGIDVAAWLERPGLPADAPRPRSASLAAVDRELERAAAGAGPGELETGGWTTQQWLRFLRGLPEGLTAEDMGELDAVFAFTRSENSEILCQWLELSIRHGYAPADAKLEAFLAEVGRRKFLKPLYVALEEADAARAKALYARNRARYHSVATSTLDPLLGWKG